MVIRRTDGRLEAVLMGRRRADGRGRALGRVTYNAGGQRVAKESGDGLATGFLYDHRKLLHETDDIGGAVSRTYASDTSDEFGDLIGEEGEFSHQYDAMANADALLDDAGTVEARYKYFAFGEVRSVSVVDAPCHWT